LAGHFLADDQPAEGRSDDGGGLRCADLIREGLAEPLDGWHILQGQGALKVLAAVQAAAQDEVPFEQRAGLAEEFKSFGLCHRGMEHQPCAPRNPGSWGGTHLGFNSRDGGAKGSAR